MRTFFIMYLIENVRFLLQFCSTITMIFFSVRKNKCILS